MKTDQAQLDFDVAYEKFMKFFRQRREKLVQQATRARAKGRALTRQEGRAGRTASFSGGQDKYIREQMDVGAARKEEKRKQKEKNRKKSEGFRIEYERTVQLIQEFLRLGKANPKLLNDLFRKAERAKKELQKLGFPSKLKLPKRPPAPKKPKKPPTMIEELRGIRQRSAHLTRGSITLFQKRKILNQKARSFIKKWDIIEKVNHDNMVYEVERGKTIFTAIMNTVESLYQAKQYDKADLQMREAHIVLTAMQAWMPVVSKIPSLTEYSDSSTKLKRQP